jgi:hypothetical protein
MAFNLDSYETVEDRLKKFWADNPNGRIETHVAKINDEGTMVIVKALVYKDFDDEKPVSTGYAQEYKGQGGFANKEASLENCETSAIGRALANWKYQGSDKARPTREEMSKSSNATQSDTTVKAPLNTDEKKQDKVVVSASATTTPARGPIKELVDAGYKVTERNHPTGELAIDEVGLWCPCGGAVKYVPVAEKKSDKSPDFRCIMASKCTAGDTVDGKVFSKSWWVENKITPKAWNDYAGVQNGLTMPKGKSMSDIKDGEAPF